MDAFRDLAAERTIVQELTSALKTPREQLPDRIAALMADLKAAERRIAQFEAAALGAARAGAGRECAQGRQRDRRGRAHRHRSTPRTNCARW